MKNFVESLGFAIKGLVGEQNFWTRIFTVYYIVWATREVSIIRAGLLANSANENEILKGEMTMLCYGIVSVMLFYMSKKAFDALVDFLASKVKGIFGTNVPPGAQVTRETKQTESVSVQPAVAPQPVG